MKINNRIIFRISIFLTCNASFLSTQWQQTNDPYGGDIKYFVGNIRKYLLSKVNQAKSKIYFLQLFISVILIQQMYSCKKEFESYNTVTDIDGNIYHTVTIGTQVWFAENLKVTHYRNGDPIPNITDSLLWSNLSTGAYCDYNKESSNSKIYGRLYNYYSIVDSRNICPSGWHIPSDSEWTILATYLGGGSKAGGKLKAAGTMYWNIPNAGATNKSGFTALPSGYRDELGEFHNIGMATQYWSTSESDTALAYFNILSYEIDDIFSNISDKKCAMSVRCLKN